MKKKMKKKMKRRKKKSGKNNCEKREIFNHNKTDPNMTSVERDKPRYTTTTTIRTTRT